jgi:hypothetical protein
MKTVAENKALQVPHNKSERATVVRIDQGGSIHVAIDETLHTVSKTVVGDLIVNVGDHVAVTRRHHAIVAIRSTDVPPARTTPAGHFGTITSIRPNGPATLRTDDGQGVTISRHLFGDGVGGNGDMHIGDRYRFELENGGVAARIWKIDNEREGI